VNLIVRLARENSSWGYDRIAGALTNLGYKVSHQTVGNVLSGCVASFVLSDAGSLKRLK
jgi:hypothetical protein